MSDNEEERKQKATAIVVEILELLKSKNLTMQDASRILNEVVSAVFRPLYALEETQAVSVPEEIDWEYRRLPKFTKHQLDPPS